MNHWDKRFIGLTQYVAEWSEDTSRKVGAVIVGPENEIRSTGFNGFPRKVKNLPERNSREGGEKYYWFEHAERNAIYNAARNGVNLEGSRVYVNLFPCADCARGIIQAGITKVVAPKPPEIDVYGRSFEVSLQMFLEADVDVEYSNIE